MLLTIEKMIYGGDGLARLPADEHGRGKAAFIPFVLEREQIEATITDKKPGFVRARAESILEPSSHRTQAQCPYFGSCGGCQYQHATYEHQLEIKRDILRETLRRTAKIDLDLEIQIHPSPPWKYRNRSRLQVEAKSFKVGYFRMASHELLNVEECPISSPLINRGISSLWKSGREGKVPQGVREVEFFANADDTQLLIGVSSSQETRRPAVRAWAEEFQVSMPEIAGVVVFREATARGNRIQEKLVSTGADHLIYRTQKTAYRVSAGSFFQTNRHLTDELVKIVSTGRGGELALDLYAGVGLFSLALASDFRHVVSVESSQTSTADLSYNLASNGVAVQATTEQYLSGTEKAGRSGKGTTLPHISHTPDLAVVDPPRSGLGERVARMLATLGAPRVVYVSCDPVTLARDLVIFLGAGYRIEQLHLVDLFPQTYHLESVVHLAR